MSGIAIASSRHSVGAQCKTWRRLRSKRFWGIHWRAKQTEKQGFQCLNGVSFQRNCGAASVGVLQDNLVLSTELTM